MSCTAVCVIGRCVMALGRRADRHDGSTHRISPASGTARPPSARNAGCRPHETVRQRAPAKVRRRHARLAPRSTAPHRTATHATACVRSRRAAPPRRRRRRRPAASGRRFRVDARCRRCRSGRATPTVRWRRIRPKRRAAARGSGPVTGPVPTTPPCPSAGRARPADRRRAACPNGAAPRRLRRGTRERACRGSPVRPSGVRSRRAARARGRARWPRP